MNDLSELRSALLSWSDGPKHILVDSLLYSSDVFTLLQKEKNAHIANIYEWIVMDSYGRPMQWVKYFYPKIACIVVVSNSDIADDMRKIRPDLEIRKVELK